VQNRKPILDYSSPAQEQERERDKEDLRQKAIENYNESTFGERRPIRSGFARFAVMSAVGVLIILLLPRAVARVLMWAPVGIFFVWQGRAEGWRVPRSSFLRPWKWW
jgi:hypothetical protein